MLRLPTCAPRFNRSFSSTKLISKKKIKPLITRFKDSTTIMSEPSSSSTQEEDSDLVASLHVLSAKSPKLVKSSVYSSAPSDDDGSSSSIQIRSWKMNEFKYYDVPSPFPTLARGLFTREMMMQEEEEKQQQKKRYQIVVRGYDKFFNIGEVPWTTVCIHSLFILFFKFLIFFKYFFLVAFTSNTYSCTVHSFLKIKWMHHLHSRFNIYPINHHLQTLSRTRRWNRRQSCSSRRSVVEKAFNKEGKDGARFGQETLGIEFNCRRRGQPFFFFSFSSRNGAFCFYFNLFNLFFFCVK